MVAYHTSTIGLSLWLLIINTNGTPHEDIMNMHTYDWYDWFLFVSIIIAFGLICLIIGCLWHKYLVKKSNQLQNNLNDQILYERSTTNNLQQSANAPKIIHKTTKTKLITIDENHPEYEYEHNQDNNNFEILINNDSNITSDQL